MNKKKIPIQSNRYIASFLCLVLCVFYQLISSEALAGASPYAASYHIYKITRPGSFADGSEWYELKKPNNKGGMFRGRDMPEPFDTLHESEVESVPGHDVMGEGTQAATPVKSKPQSYVRYDPVNGPRPEEVAKLAGGALNIICKNDEVWFQVDSGIAKEHFSSMQVEEGESITSFLKPDKHMDIETGTSLEEIQRIPVGVPRLGKPEEIAQLDEEIKSLCFQSTNVLGRSSIRFGHARLEVNETGFDFKSWFKSWNWENPWYFPKESEKVRAEREARKPKKPIQADSSDHDSYEKALRRYEEEVLMEEEQQKVNEELIQQYRQSRNKASVFKQYWPDWLDNILMDERPFMHERGSYPGSYVLKINREGVEDASIYVKLIDMAQLYQESQSQFLSRQKSSQSYNVETAQVTSGFLLPYHIILGSPSKIKENQYTHTPFARPRLELEIKPLKQKVYYTFYQPEVLSDSSNNKPEYIKAIVYDFEPEVNDAGLRDRVKQPRLTYWVGLVPPYEGVLLGRRILYRELDKKPIQCSDGSTGCYFTLPRYRGIDYRLLVHPEKKKEAQKKEVTHRVPGASQNKESVRRRGLREVIAPAGMSAKQKLEWQQKMLAGGGSSGTRRMTYSEELLLNAVEFMVTNIIIPVLMGELQEIHSQGIRPKGYPSTTDFPVPATTITHMLRKLELVN